MKFIDEIGFVPSAMNAKINALVAALNSEQKNVYSIQVEMKKKDLMEHYLSNPLTDENKLLSLVEQWF